MKALRICLLLVLSLNTSLYTGAMDPDPLGGTHHTPVQNLPADPDHSSGMQSTDIACRETGFWTVSSPGGQILEWDLTAGAVVFRDTLFAASPLSSLAFSDTMNPGFLNRTLYGSNFYTGSDLYYYDGVNWVTLSPSPGMPMANAAGYHHYLYYTTVGSGASYLNELYRFNGSQLTLVYQLPAGREFAFADFAVDINGNVWCPTGGYGTQADSLIVIDPSGVVIRAFSFSMDTQHGYGAFMMNNILYLAFGSGNPSYPSSLVALGFSGTTASVQQVIPFPNSDFLDIASCTPGLPLILDRPENPVEQDNWTVFPNPGTGDVTIMMGSGNFSGGQYSVFDSRGRLLLQGTLERNASRIPASVLDQGLYLIRIADQQDVVHDQIFIKE